VTKHCKKLTYIIYKLKNLLKIRINSTFGLNNIYLIKLNNFKIDILHNTSLLFVYISHLNNNII